MVRALLGATDLGAYRRNRHQKPERCRREHGRWEIDLWTLYDIDGQYGDVIVVRQKRETLCWNVTEYAGGCTDISRKQMDSSGIGRVFAKVECTRKAVSRTYVAKGNREAEEKGRIAQLPAIDSGDK